MQQKWEEVLRGGIVANHETMRIHKDGHCFDVSISMAPIRDRDGKIIGVARISRDITERKQAEAVRIQLAAVINASNDAVVSRDKEGKILSWNRGAEVLFGYSAKEMIGRDVARQVRAIRAELPVAVTSGFIDETLRTQAQSAGVQELIFKADDVEVYCATIHRLAESFGTK